MLTKVRRIMHKQSENVNNEMKCQPEIPEMKNTVTEMENSIEGFSGRVGRTEERIGKLKSGIHPVRAE